MAPEKERYQVTINLSQRAYEEMASVAEWKEIPLATHLRMILEREHESPSYSNLVRQSKTQKTGKRADEDNE